MSIKNILVADLSAVVKELGVQDVVPAVDYPADSTKGDYASNVALVLSKKLGKAPMEVAESIAQKLKNQDYTVSVAQPGFINFFIKDGVFTQKVQGILEAEKTLLPENKLTEQRVMFEYAHPNTHKEMHIGHMRTLITGEALARLAEAAGAYVFRANYQGDIGPHVAKAMFGIQTLMKNENLTLETVRTWSNKEKAHFLGRGYAEGVKLYDDGSFKKEIDDTNAFLYQKCAGEPLATTLSAEEQTNLWNLYEETRKWSLDYYDEFYLRFYTVFDQLFFERDMVAKGKALVTQNVGKIFDKSENTIIFPGEKYGLHTRVFITGLGYPTYEGKEMANAFTEYEAFPFDQKVHIVANEQAGYFQVVFKALELIDPEKFKDKQKHLSMGMVQLKDRKMSSRTGDVLTVDWLLDQVKERVEKLATEGRIDASEKEKTIEQIVIGAVKYSVLKVGVTQDATFDIETSVSLDGNSGPYLQYSYARTQSVLAKEQNAQGATVSTNVKLAPEERELLRLLSRFEEIVEDAAVRMAPNTLCTYLFDVAQTFNLFYQKCPILKAEGETRSFRLALTATTGKVIRQGLSLLGIQAPARM